MNTHYLADDCYFKYYFLGTQAKVLLIHHRDTMYSALLVILLVTGNIGADGDDREDTPNRSYRKQRSRII